MRFILTNPKKQNLYGNNYLAASSAFIASFALIFASISLAISGLSCNIVFTESRPCPSLLLS